MVLLCDISKKMCFSRQTGQNTTEEVRARDLRRELEDKERDSKEKKNREKRSFTGKLLEAAQL